MAHQNAQKVARDRADVLDRAAELRRVLGHPRELRDEAERLLAVVPNGCDLLAWSPEGYNVALVAAVLADEIGRELIVHRASLVTPLAPSLRRKPWTWACAEELLGLGPPRAWAAAWATAQQGSPDSDSAVELALVQ